MAMRRLAQMCRPIQPCPKTASPHELQLIHKNSRCIPLLTQLQLCAESTPRRFGVLPLVNACAEQRLRCAARYHPHINYNPAPDINCSHWRCSALLATLLGLGSRVSADLVLQRHMHRLEKLLCYVCLDPFTLQ